MKPLTDDEHAFALDQLIAGERQALARVRWQLLLHRDVLTSPADTVAALEVQAAKSAQAIEWMETQRAHLLESGADGAKRK
jgi:hypothetical protein